MQTLAEIRRLLSERGLAPRHALGQNFLLDHNLIRKLVDEAGLSGGLSGREVVLEVGPGTGVLTEELLARGASVVACELDRGLAALLRERLGDREAFRLVEGDCLEGKTTLNPALVAALGDEPFVLVSNLPYGAATPLMMTLLCDHPRCRGMFVTIQREVADRLMAGPGSRDYGPISVVAQALAEVRRVASLPPECFWPRPEVHSAMVAVRRLERPMTDEARRLSAFCARAFGQRRKQLGSILGKAVAWPEGITPQNRIEELSVERVVALARAAG